MGAGHLHFSGEAANSLRLGSNPIPRGLPDRPALRYYPSLSRAWTGRFSAAHLSGVGQRRRHRPMNSRPFGFDSSRRRYAIGSAFERAASGKGDVHEPTRVVDVARIAAGAAKRAAGLSLPPTVRDRMFPTRNTHHTVQQSLRLRIDIAADLHNCVRLLTSHREPSSLRSERPQVGPDARTGRLHRPLMAVQ